MANNQPRPAVKIIGFAMLTLASSFLLLLFWPVGWETLEGTVIRTGVAAGSGLDGGNIELAWVQLADRRQVSARVQFVGPLQAGDNVYVLCERRAAGNDLYSVVRLQRQ